MTFKMFRSPFSKGFRSRQRSWLRSWNPTVIAATALLLSGCVTSIPVDEYTLARAAYEAAKDADAPRYAPALWFSAEQMYREAVKNFRDRRYEKAEANFIQAKNLAEQAENVARLARHQSGEIAP